jgi:CRISPR/Cas system-associated exonuclease Cas4 (RecB family)
MARGLLDEERVKIILMQLGYELTEAQRIMEWPAYEIAGRIDWNFIVDGKSYPCDCKSVSGHVMAKARREFGAGKIEDRTLRKYLVQVNLYCIMKSIDHGFFVFYSPEDHDIFVPVVELDYDLAEETLKKCEAVNAAMKGVGEPPALGDWDVCPRCDFFHLCSPELVGEEGADLSPELAERLNLILNERERMEGEIKGTVREIERLKKEEKEMVKERPLIMLRDWIVTGKLVKRAAQAATEFWGHWPRHK